MELFSARQGAQEGHEDDQVLDEDAEEERGRLYETMLGQLKNEQIGRSGQQQVVQQAQ
jgi:hypothetical protein